LKGLVRVPSWLLLVLFLVVVVAALVFVSQRGWARRLRRGRDREGVGSHPFAGLAIWWLWMPVLIGVIWFIDHVLASGIGTWKQDLDLGLKTLMWPRVSFDGFTALFWIWFAVGVVGTMVIVGVNGWRGGAFSGLALSAGLALCLVMGWIALWDNDKDQARYYSRATVLHLPSIDPAPSSVRILTGKAARGGSGGCDLTGTADVRACVRVGALPALGWSPRTAAYEAAGTVMNASGALTSKVDLMRDTITYLPGAQPGTGVWTGILDGSGWQQPTEGVVSWNGTSNTATVCHFGDRGDEFDRAFDGTRRNSLSNLLADEYPQLVYDTDDMWGECVDGQPRIVIPVARVAGWHSRTVLTPAGVLVLTGSASGRPHVDYHARVGAGDFDGPVYPESLVKQQITATQWLSGRGDKNRYQFGYTYSTVDTNASNRGEYVMRSTVDGHLYFVSPLTPRGSQSQAIVAYAVVRADEVGAGLNTLDVYVLSDNDPGVTNLNTLASTMQSYINSVDPGLLSTGSGGSLKEIIPLGNGRWRGFLDVRGITTAYLDLANDNSSPPNLVSLAGGRPTQSGGGNGSSAGTGDVCGQPPASLSAAQIDTCIKNFLDELQKRVPSPSAAPSPSR
jgi:hypothetical protein